MSIHEDDKLPYCWIILLPKCKCTLVHDRYQVKCFSVRENVTLEVSGGITLKNIASFAKIGVDAISSGQITSSAPAIDLSLEVCP